MNHDLEAQLSALARAGDEDRWLAAGYAAGEARRRLLALYAFHAELARIPAMVSEPLLGEMRLQWLRDALRDLRAGEAVSGHPVFEALAATDLLAAPAADALGQAINARARLLYAEDPFRDADDLADWLMRAESYLDRLAVCALGADQAVCEAAGDAGLAFALARLGPALAPDHAKGAAEKARALYDRARRALAVAPAALAPALAHLALTRAYVIRARRGRPFPVEKRLRIFFSILTGRV